jgi:hypothetical protein
MKSKWYIVNGCNIRVVVSRLMRCSSRMAGKVWYLLRRNTWQIQFLYDC